MKKTKEVYFDLEDLGKSIFIDSCAFGAYNSLGVGCEVFLSMNDSAICKEFDIPETDIAVDLFLEHIDDNGVDGILFTCAKDVFTSESTYSKDGYDDRYTLFTFSEDSDDGLSNVHFNTNFIRVLEAYATVQFFNSLGFKPDMDYDDELLDISLTEADHTKKYLIANNYDELSKDPVQIKGKNIDYPTK